VSNHRSTMNTATATDPLSLPSVDLNRRFVRVLERRSDGQVSFEFSIGWPELAVELMLPTAAFDEFCARHEVIWRDN